MTTENRAELALELGRSMAEMRNYLRGFIQAKIKESGMNISFEMLEILACLWKKDGINQQEIAVLTIKDKSSMTYLVDNLAKRNMVTRVADENDRRNNLIFLTKEGKALQKKLNPWLLEMYNKATGGVKPHDIEAATTLTKKMIDNLKE